MNHVVCTCGRTFTDNPIVALLEHRERDHCPFCNWPDVVHHKDGWNLCNWCSEWWKAVAA